MPSTDDTTQRADLSLAEDIAEVHREVQVRANNVKAATQALADANASLDEAAVLVATISPTAAAYIADFRNPATPEPPPIVPEVPPSVVTVEPAPVNAGGDDAGGAAAVRAGQP